MSERVRIYELARKMNLPAPTLIDACRELGYDVKSHSSTIDGHVVGLVIAHLGKKKQAPEKPEPKAAAAAAAAPAKAPATGASKASAKTVAPPPPVVKPRVLARYRREPVVEPGDVVAEPAAPALASCTNGSAHSSRASEPSKSRLEKQPPEVERHAPVEHPPAAPATSDSPGRCRSRNKSQRQRRLVRHRYPKQCSNNALRWSRLSKPPSVPSARAPSKKLCKQLKKRQSNLPNAKVNPVAAGATSNRNRRTKAAKVIYMHCVMPSLFGP